MPNPFADLIPQQGRQQQMPPRAIPGPPRLPPPQTPVNAEMDRVQLENARLAGEKTRRELANNPPPPSIDSKMSSLTGDALLSNLPKAQAIQVKALAEGRMAFPTGFALRSPYWQNMLGYVSQYDPTFDAINYTARQKVRSDFTSGASSRNVKALNTALGHVGQLHDQISGTASHGGFPLATDVNAIENWVMRHAGASGITKFDQTASAVSSELTQVFRGSGGAEADVQRYLSELNSNASREQKVAAVRNIAGLLKSRLDALNDQYEKGMGTDKYGLKVLDPHAEEVLRRISGGQPRQQAPRQKGLPPGVTVRPLD